MARHFTKASGDNIVFAPGTAGSTVGGPSTVAVLWRASLVAGSLVDGTLFDVTTAGAAVVASFRPIADGRLWHAYNGATNYTQGGVYAAAAWRIDVWTKPAGNSAVRVHSAVSGGAWSHTTYAAKTDSATPGAHITIGTGGLAGALSGDVAAAMLITRVISDAEAETLWSGLAAWATVIGASNAGLWAFTQSAVSTPVPDLTGGGADQASISGTTVVADPPGFDFTLTPPTLGVLTGTLPVVVGAAAGTSRDASLLAGILPAPVGAAAGTSRMAAHLAGQLPTVRGYYAQSVFGWVPPVTASVMVEALTGTATVV
jgi:hypothetical protein